MVSEVLWGGTLLVIVPSLVYMQVSTTCLSCTNPCTTQPLPPLSSPQPCVAGTDLDRCTVNQFKVYSLYSIIYLSTLITPSLFCTPGTPPNRPASGSNGLKCPDIQNSWVLLFLILYLESSPSSNKCTSSCSTCIRGYPHITLVQFWLFETPPPHC